MEGKMRSNWRAKRGQKEVNMEVVENSLSSLFVNRTGSAPARFSRKTRRRPSVLT